MVEIYNRLDSYKERINGAQVYLSFQKMSGNGGVPCGDKLQGSKDKYVLNCENEFEARYVMIKGKDLNLREVKVLTKGSISQKIDEEKNAVMNIINSEAKNANDRSKELEKKIKELEEKIAKNDNDRSKELEEKIKELEEKIKLAVNESIKKSLRSIDERCHKPD